MHVSASGNDDNEGTRNSPLRSLHAAIQMIATATIQIGPFTSPVARTDVTIENDNINIYGGYDVVVEPSNGNVTRFRSAGAGLAIMNASGILVQNVVVEAQDPYPGTSQRRAWCARFSCR